MREQDIDLKQWPRAEFLTPLKQQNLIRKQQEVLNCIKNNKPEQKLGLS